MSLVLVQQTDTDVDPLAAVLSPGPQLQLAGAGEVVTTVLIAPVVRGMLPGDTDPAAVADITHLDAGRPLVRVLRCEHPSRVSESIDPIQPEGHPGHALEAVLVYMERHWRASLTSYQQRHIGRRRIAGLVMGVQEESIRARVPRACARVRHRHRLRESRPPCPAAWRGNRRRSSYSSASGRNTHWARTGPPRDRR